MSLLLFHRIAAQRGGGLLGRIVATMLDGHRARGQIRHRPAAPVSLETSFGFRLS